MYARPCAWCLTPLLLPLPPPAPLLPAAAAAILAEALAQRIDATLPVGSDPARFAAWQAAHPGGEQEQPAEEADVAQWETEPAPEAAAEAAEATEAAAEAAE